MASIYKHPGTTKWYARIKQTDGTWKNTALSCRHTGLGFVTARIALLEAQEREEMMLAEVRGELTIQAITEAGKRIMERNHGGTLKRLTIRDYLKDWLKNRTLRISEATVESYTTQVDRFLEIIGARADRSLLSLKVELLEEHRDKLLEQLSTATVILHCKTIGSALSDAQVCERS